MEKERMAGISNSQPINVLHYPNQNVFPTALQELCEIESDGGSFSNEPIGRSRDKTPSGSDDDDVPPICKTITTQRHDTTQIKRNCIGKMVARDFGKQGLFIGEVVDLECDTEDEGQESHFYVVQYTEGDREDMEEDNFTYALELYQTLDEKKVINELFQKKNDMVPLTSGSDDEDSYVPSPKVTVN